MLEGLYSEIQLKNGKCYTNVTIYKKMTIFYFLILKMSLIKIKSLFTSI